MITADMVKRKIIFDSMADPQKASVLAGLVGVSDDVSEKEQEDSIRRMQAVVPLFPILTTISEWLADIAVSLNIESGIPEGTEVPEEFLTQMHAMFLSIIQGSLCSSMSVLADLGLIEVKVVEGEC